MKGTELHSDRLRLRLISLTDLAVIHELHSLPETDAYNTLGIPNNIDQTRGIITAWIYENLSKTPRQITWAIERKTDATFIGLMALKTGNEKFKSAEVWYKLHVNHWGKGYATEALKTLINYGFDVLELHRIEAGSAVNNIGSIRVLEKAGMTREGQKRKVLPLKTGWSDNYEYAILETDLRD